MTPERITQLASDIRQSLRDQGLMPSYTDASKGPFPQPPILQTMLENALRKHLNPLDLATIAGVRYGKDGQHFAQILVREESGRECWFSRSPMRTNGQTE